MARSDPEKLAQALRANLKRRKMPSLAKAPEPPRSGPGQDPSKPPEKPPEKSV